MNKLSYRIALGGIISSICLGLMFFTGVIPLLYLTLPMFAGMLIMIMSAEINTKWAFLTYAAVGTLSLFVTFDKEAALIFIIFFGHYPIIKEYVDRIRNKPLRMLIKAVIYNICILADFGLTIKLLGNADMLEDFSDFGKYGALIFLILTNIIFALYDYTLDGVKRAYNTWFKPKILRKH